MPSGFMGNVFDRMRQQVVEQNPGILSDQARQNAARGEFGGLLNVPGLGSAPGIAGMRTLMDILNRQGATRAEPFNRLISNILNQSEGQARAFERGAAARGTQHGGVDRAIAEAIRGGGLGRVADTRAREIAMTEDRMRSDLGLLLQMIIGPSMDYDALLRESEFRRRQMDEQSSAANLAFISSLFGSGMQLPGAIRDMRG